MVKNDAVTHQWCDPSSSSSSSSRQEEVARLAALQPQVDLLEKRLNELKGEKEGEEDPSAFLDADINALKEHYNKVLEDLRARERRLQLGERQDRWFWVCLHQNQLVHFLLIIYDTKVTVNRLTEYLVDKMI